MLFEFEDVQFASPLVGWVVENDCAQGKAYVDRTHDGGRRWEKTPVRSTNCAAGSRLDLSFADTSHGWLLDVYENGSGPYPLERTLDGGATWRPVGRVPIAGRIVFRTAREGWLSRADFAQPQQLYATVDGGRSWQRRVLPTPPGWTGARIYPDVPVFFGVRGVLPASVVGAGRAAVAFYVTPNGGRTWSVASVREVSGPVTGRHSPFAAYVPTGIPSAGTWWMVNGGSRTRIAITTNAGRTWRVAASAGLPTLRSATLSPADGQHAWLVNFAQGRLLAYSTRDAGRTWQRLTLPAK